MRGWPLEQRIPVGRPVTSIQDPPLGAQYDDGRSASDVEGPGQVQRAVADVPVGQAQFDDRALQLRGIHGIVRPRHHADDLQVGVLAAGGHQVRRFRASSLELRRDPRLVDKLYERKDRVHARLLPGYDAKGLDRIGGSFFVIGPDKQLDAWEQSLQGAEGSGTRLQRLYGRDFWMP